MIEVGRRATWQEGAGRWSTVGLVAGAAASVAVCLGNQQKCKAPTGWSDGSLREGLIEYASEFGVIGGLYGALGGATFRGDRWQVVPISVPR
ncbi:MAG TPA: hypothetical protein VFS08_12270 [Gemmatimonadaceae bacterium]|nr:hypothetical protein [Gemmatimonadaceae bacterium]